MNKPDEEENRYGSVVHEGSMEIYVLIRHVVITSQTALLNYVQSCFHVEAGAEVNLVEFKSACRASERLSRLQSSRVATF